MNDDRNRSQIIRIDARNCFVESLNDAFEIGKAHFTFASYDLSKPSGQRQTNSIQIYIDMAEVLELCRKLVGGELRYSHVCMELLRCGSRTSCVCRTLLEESYHGRDPLRNGCGLYGLHRLETGGAAPWSRCNGSWSTCLCCGAGHCKSCHL